MKKKSLPFALLAAFAVGLQPSGFAQTPVEFPLSTMFGGNPYSKSFTLQAAQPFITNGTNVWVGSSLTTNAPGGTNITVLLTPNTYLVTFPDATYPWRIAVPNTTNLQNALNLSTGPLPTFLVTPNTPLSSGAGVIIENIGGTNIAGIDPNVVITNKTPLVLKYKYIGETGDGFKSVSILEAFNPTNTFSPPIKLYSDPARLIHTPTHIYAAGKYWMFYETSHTNGVFDTLGVATSPDDYQWTFNSYFPFPTNTWSMQWSPKLFYGPTNDLHLMVLMSANGNYFQESLFDLNNANPTNWSNFRQLIFTNTPSGPNSLSGYLIYNNGQFYFFDGIGSAYYSPTLATNTWTEYIDQASGTITGLGPAPVVVNMYGLWYDLTWPSTIAGPLNDLGVEYFMSPDLTNWVQGTVALDGFLNEGTPIVENVPTSILTINPLLNGNATILTNLNLNNTIGILPATALPYPAQGGSSILTNIASSNPGLNFNEAVVTNTVGPHGWTNFYGYGILTNKTPW